MRILKLLDKHMEEIFLVLFFSIMVISIFTQIIMRQVFNSSLAWSEELARYSFIWLVFISVSYAAKHQRHLNIDALVNIFNERKKSIFFIIGNSIFLLFCFIFIIHGTGNVVSLMGSQQLSPSLHLPMSIIYLSLPVGLGLTSIRLIQNLFEEYTFFRKSQESRKVM